MRAVYFYGPKLSWLVATAGEAADALDETGDIRLHLEWSVGWVLFAGTVLCVFRGWDWALALVRHKWFNAR